MRLTGNAVNVCARWVIWTLLCFSPIAEALAPAGAPQISRVTTAQAGLLVDGQRTDTEVQLPFLWDQHFPGKSGTGILEIVFSADPAAHQLYGIYFAKVSNAYRITLNGGLLDQDGVLNQFNTSDTKLPRLLSVPEGVLRESNRLQIEFHADAGRQGGVSVPVIGPYEVVKAAYLEHWRWRFLIPVSVAIFSALVGLIGALLWLTQADVDATGQRRRDSIYLFGALAEFFWMLRLMTSVIEQPPFPLSWFSIASSLALGGWGCCVVLFGMYLAKWHEKRPRLRTLLYTAVVVLMVSGFGTSVAAWSFGFARALTLWYAGLGAFFLGFGVVFARLAFANGAGWQMRLFAAAIFFNVLAGCLDLYFFRIAPRSNWGSMLYISSVFFGLAAGGIVIVRFRALGIQVNMHTKDLDSRLVRKERELSEIYLRSETLAREQERTAERARILRDMHDGVGSHISSAIRQLQVTNDSGNKGGRDEVLLTLRDALDQLKLSIDAINLPPGDITALLANLRYRLEPRMAASGIALQWDVDLLPVLARLDASAMRQLQFMLLEALSNVLQHARARNLRIEAHASAADVVGGGQTLLVRVVDDGVGFDVQIARKKGLSSMYERAAAIGARLEIVSEPGRTAVEIAFS